LLFSFCLGSLNQRESERGGKRENICADINIMFQKISLSLALSLSSIHSTINVVCDWRQWDDSKRVFNSNCFLAVAVAAVAVAVAAVVVAAAAAVAFAVSSPSITFGWVTLGHI